MVCTCGKLDCNSVFGTDNGVIATPVRLDCWSAGEVTTIARGL